MTRTYEQQRHGFTLIELLVVVSIIALLISILLPAVGTARRSARMSVDVQSMKQHGVGMELYSSQNDSELLNAPKVPRTASGVSPYGRVGRTAQRFGDKDFPSPAGFAFADPVPALYDIGGGLFSFNDNSIFSRMSMFDAYWLVLAEYMVDGEGIGALEDVFYSSADLAGKRDRDRLFTDLEQNLGDWNSVMAGINDLQSEKGPSFRYAVISMLANEAQTRPTWNNNVGARLDQDESTFYEFIRRRSQAGMKFPSQKGTFFMQDAFYNPEFQFWFEPSVNSPVLMGDGSARISEVYNETIWWDPDDCTGVFIYFIIEDGPNSDALYPPTIMITEGGLKGRDLDSGT